MCSRGIRKGLATRLRTGFKSRVCTKHFFLALASVVLRKVRKAVGFKFKTYTQCLTFKVSFFTVLY